MTHWGEAEAEAAAAQQRSTAHTTHTTQQHTLHTQTTPPSTAHTCGVRALESSAGCQQLLQYGPLPLVLGLLLKLLGLRLRDGLLMLCLPATSLLLLLFLLPLRVVVSCLGYMVPPFLLQRLLPLAILLRLLLLLPALQLISVLFQVRNQSLTGWQVGGEWPAALRRQWRRHRLPTTQNQLQIDSLQSMLVFHIAEPNQMCGRRLELFTHGRQAGNSGGAHRHLQEAIQPIPRHRSHALRDIFHPKAAAPAFTSTSALMRLSLAA
jgi:hypothetical protein